MKTLNSILALAIGLVAGIGLTVAVPVLAQNVALPSHASGYVKDSVSLAGRNVYILEDYKRNRVCYIIQNGSGSSIAIDCDVLDRRMSR